MATKEIGSTGHYATLDLWEAYLNGVGAFGADEIGQVQNQELTQSVVTTFDGSSPGAFRIILEAVSGGSFRDHADKLTNRLAYVSTYGACVRKTSGSGELLSINDPNFTLRNLMLKKDSAYSGMIVFVDITNTGQQIDNCVIAQVAGAWGVTFKNLAMTNTVMYSDGVGRLGDLSNGTNSMFNCVTANLGAAGSTTGLSLAYGTSTVSNTAVLGFNTDASGTIGGTNNATDKSSSGMPATNLQTSLVGSTEFENVASFATADFRLKSTSAKCKDNGTASGAPSLDTIGQSRSGSTDIGAWEYQAAGGASVVPILNSYRQRRL